MFTLREHVMKMNKWLFDFAGLKKFKRVKMKGIFTKIGYFLR